MSPLQATLWRKVAIATAFDLCRRLVAGVADLHRAGAITARRVRERIVSTAIATRRGFDRFGTRAQASALELAAAVRQQRHGTWLILFGLLFTLLWLLAGWIGMANGIWRGVLVGIVTPLGVSALFPLRRSAR
jgi:hypothetical protein